MIKNKRIFLIILAALALYLIFSNSIFLLFVPENKRFYNYKSSAEISESSVFAAISDLQYGGDVYETLMISGWVACVDNKKDLEKTVKFVLKNDTSSYASLPLELSSNTQAKTLFKDNIDKDKISFSALLSTINIKSGSYNAYLEISFDDKDLMLYDLGQSYKKTGTRFELSTQASAIEPMQFQIDESIVCAVSEQPNTKQGLSVIGWCHYADKTPTEKIAIELQFESGNVKYFEIQSVCNLDVAQMENNPALIKSAFNTRVPPSELEKGNIKLTLLLCKNNIWSKSRVVAQFLY